MTKNLHLISTFSHQIYIQLNYKFLKTGSFKTTSAVNDRINFIKI